MLGSGKQTELGIEKNASWLADQDQLNAEFQGDAREW